jgi:hypothetical protein
MSDALTRFFQAKGQFVKVVFATEKRPKAAHKGAVLRKHTTGVFRAGIDFSKLKSVQDGIANGERGDVQPLPWGEWERFPYLISHKEERYLRLYPAVNGKVTTTYTVNGQTVDKVVFDGYLTPSDAKAPDKPLECFTVKLSNVISIADIELDNMEEAA